MFKNRLLDSMGEGEGGMIWEYSDDLNVDCSVTKTILHQVLTHLSFKFLFLSVSF